MLCFLANAMSIDPNGSIYILDRNNGRVTKWMQGASSGTVVAGGNGIGNATNQLNSPSGMFIDSSTSNIWIADSNNNRIVKWSSPTTSVVVCGSYGSNNTQFIYPQGLFVDTSNSNTLYVADTNNHRIQMWLPGATSGITVAGITGYCATGLNQLCSPIALMVDNNQNMYIVDKGNSRILQWKIGASSGTIIAGNGTSGTQATQLNSPNRINFDSSGSLYVADTLNNRIQKYLISCRKFNLYIDPIYCLFFCSTRIKYLDHNSFISNNNR
jgi:sugar lactone lactonase YvrE